MKRNLILGAFALIVIVSTALFISSVSANGSTDKKDGRNVASPAVSTTLVISQAYGGGGGTTGTYLNDYVEIKNISNTTQSLAGLALYYGSSTGQFASSATNAYTLTGTSLAAGKYYLIQLSSAGTGGVALPVTADETTTNLSMSGTNGKVALVVAASLPVNTCGATATPCTLPNAAILDTVSWGAATNAEGGAPTNGGVALTSVQGNVRKNGGCTDTDNNNADFDIITAPVPRNSATTAALCGAPPITHRVMDFDGDGKSDFAVTRDSGAQKTWYIYNGVTPEPGGTTYQAWGLNTDTVIPADYDGDGKADIAVWRSGAAGTAGFYIFQSSTGTVRFDNFGQTGDDPSVVADYDGDGKADPAVFRPNPAVGGQCYFYYRGSTGPYAGQIVYNPWGATQANGGDFPVPGDFDGDGKADFLVSRDGGGQAIYFLRTATGAVSSFYFGLPTDIVTPGDFDGDGKTDVAIARQVVSPSARDWYYKPSSAPAEAFRFLGRFGLASDVRAIGDYDGDGKTDIGVWRSNADASSNYFYYLGSTSGFKQQEWGQSGDVPVARYQEH